MQCAFNEDIFPFLKPAAVEGSSHGYIYTLGAAPFVFSVSLCDAYTGDWYFEQFPSAAMNRKVPRVTDFTRNVKAVV